MSFLGILAQENGEEEVVQQDGHFVDQFVDLVTSPEGGETLADWLSTAIEWIILLGMFAVPILMILGGARAKKIGLGAGGAVALAAIWWYRSTEDWNLRDNSVLDNWQIPVGDWVEQVVFWVDNNMKETLIAFEWPFATLLHYIADEWLLKMSWLTVCIVVFLIGWLVRNFQVGVMTFVGLVICGILGNDYWRETALTIGFIGVAVLLCVVVGIPLGVLCGRVDGAWKVVRPVLDAMQVVHSFVYMLPFIFFFGVGFVSATMVTMVFALPPLIRLTNLGIRQVPADVVEASRAYGAPERRVLFDVQLPLARPAIMTGLNQTLLLSISMLGIAAIMGAGGLGRLLFQAIANLDVAQAGSGGLAFFLVAVVLDRISQPESGDSGNLLSRISKAWANRRTPEKLIPETTDDDGSAVRKAIAEPDVADVSFLPASSKERSLGIVGAIGALVMLVSLLLPWAHNAGVSSSWARSADVDLRPTQCDGDMVDAQLLDPFAEEGALTCTGETTFLSISHNGIAASGGSWFGIALAACALVVLVASLSVVWRPGQGSRWLSAHGAMVFSAAGVLVAVAHLLMGLTGMSDKVDAENFSVGIGNYLAVIGAIVALLASLVWLWGAPMSARRPLPAGVGWGRMLGASFAVVLLFMGGYSGWSFDTRAESVITPELQAELDQIAEEARQADIDAENARAAADAAAAAGDVVTEQEQRRIEQQALQLGGIRAADHAAKISQAQRQGDVIFDGFEANGTRLGLWALIAGLVALLVTVPAIGLMGMDERFRYKWSVLVAGAGLGIALIPLAWILSLTRVADANLVSGIGSVFVLAAGVTLFAASRATLGEFERDKEYGDLPD